MRSFEISNCVTARDAMLSTTLPSFAAPGGTRTAGFVASTRMYGVSQAVEIPMAGVLAIYAQENGQGMMFSAENAPPEPPPATAKSDDAVKKPHLRVVK